MFGDDDEVAVEEPLTVHCVCEVLVTRASTLGNALFE
jgi:hypothetical protein